MTLLGDAAHAQLPSLGLGVSTALGDIEELIAQVQSCSKYRMCSKQKHAVSTSTYLPADYYYLLPGPETWPQPAGAAAVRAESDADLRGAASHEPGDASVDLGGVE